MGWQKLTALGLHVHCWPLMCRLAHRPTHCCFQAVDAARDKHATRAIMEEAGLPTPKNMLISTAAELPKVGAGGMGLCAHAQASSWRRQGRANPSCADLPQVQQCSHQLGARWGLLASAARLLSPTWRDRSHATCAQPAARRLPSMLGSPP